MNTAHQCTPRKQRKVCLVMFVLILSLPLHSALVFAEIRKATVHGSDNINGYRRTLNDKTIIEAEAKLSGDTDITPNQLRIAAEGRTTQFKECTKVSDGYARCTYSTNPNSLEDPAKVYPFSVQLYSDANILADEKQLSLTYDNQPPKIGIEQITQEKDIVTIAVHAEDIACLAPDCEGKCVGLKTLEVDGKSQNVSGCSVSQIISIPAKEEGSHTYIAKATDAFTQATTTESATFFVDGNDPSIEKTMTFLLDGQPIHFIGEEGVRAAWVVVRVKEHELASATADLSALNKLPEFQAMYKSINAECVRMATDRFQCMWKNIYLLPEKQTSIIQVNATDSTGRIASEQLTVDLPLDTEKPKLTRLTTSGCKDEKCYVSLANNVIRADIEERGSGFSPFTYIDGEPRYRVGLDAHELSSQYSILWADNCTGKGGSWTCFWQDVAAQGPHLRSLSVSVPALSTDDAGNTFTGDTLKRIIVDAETPVILEANASSEQGSILLEDTALSINTMVKDDTNIRGQAYVEQVIGIKEPVTIECVPQEENMHRCLWSNIGKLLPGPIKGAQIKLIFTDLGGNRAEKTLTVDVLAAEKEKKNYWQVNGKPMPMPRVMDKDTLFFEQRVYFRVPLIGPQNAKIIDGAILDCTDNNGFSLVRILSAEDGLLLQTTVGPMASDAALAKIKATCTASVMTVINNERLTKPQELTLHLEVPLVSTTPGALDDLLQKKIDDAKNWDLYGLRKIFKPLEQIYRIAEQICSGLSLFSSASAGGMLGALGGGGGGFSNGIQDNTMFASAYKYCLYLSCDKTIWGNWYNKFINEPEWSKKAHLSATAWPQNPKDNLFLSMATGCIPGVLYNLHKYKQLQCVYVDCLQNQVQQGIPMQYCVNQHEYLKCRFFYGQVFDLIPFSHFVKRMATYMKTIFANPLSMVFGLGTFACEQRYADLGTNGMICAVARTLPQALSTFTQLKQFGNLQSDLLSQGRAQNVCGKVGME